MLRLLLLGCLVPPGCSQSDKDCPQKQVPHGSTCAAGTGTCDFTCDDGYYKTGTMACTGSWSPAFSGGQCKACGRVDHCSASKCSGPTGQSCQAGRCAQGFEVGSSCGPSPCDEDPGVEHAAGTCAGHTTGGTCSEFSCELGYKPQGTLRCGTDGKWTGGQCKGESCQPLTAANATMPCHGATAASDAGSVNLLTPASPS